MKTGAALLRPTSSEAASSISAQTQNQDNEKDFCFSQGTDESSNIPATDEMKSNRKVPVNRDTLCSEEPAARSMKRQETENMDEDDLPTEQIFHEPEHNNKPPPVILREIDEDGNENVISDHSTSAGFIFQNSLMFELD